MTLESQLDKVVNLLFSDSMPVRHSAEQLIPCLDLTLLDEQASELAILDLENRARAAQVAAICLLPDHLHLLRSREQIDIATVVNFPSGDNSIEDSLSEIVKAQALGATEIDYVLPYSHYLAGKKKAALTACNEIITLCKQKQLCCKIIIETGAFPDLCSIYQVAHELIELDCTFLKTSTGKIKIGATIPAVFALASAIKATNAQVGIKVSGGVRTKQAALIYSQLIEQIIEKPINSRWFRIGASTLLDELLNKN